MTDFFFDSIKPPRCTDKYGKKVEEGGRIWVS